MCHDAREDRWGVVVVGDQEEVDGLGAGGEESFCKKGINQSTKKLHYSLHYSQLRAHRRAD
jgi:hypothetical protein